MYYKKTDLCNNHINVWRLEFRVLQGLVSPVRQFKREREMLPTSSQKGLSRVGHERPLNTNSCADQPTNNRQFDRLRLVIFSAAPYGH